MYHIVEKSTVLPLFSVFSTPFEIPRFDCKWIASWLFSHISFLPMNTS